MKSLHRQRGWFWIIPLAMAAVSAIAGAKEKKKKAKAEAAAMQYDALQRQQESEATLATYNLREESQRRRARRVQGNLRAGLAESGIGYGRGTALDVEMESAVESEMDALNIRYEGNLKARGLLAESEQQFAARREHLRGARASERAGYLSAAGTVLGGVGQYLGS